MFNIAYFSARDKRLKFWKFINNKLACTPSIQKFQVWVEKKKIENNGFITSDVLHGLLPFECNAQNVYTTM